MIWVGNSVSPQVLLDLFGVDDINLVNPKTVGWSPLRPIVHLELNLRSPVGHPRIGQHVVYPGQEHHYSQKSSGGENLEAVRRPTKHGWRRDRVQRHVGGRPE